jgi:hypothetical protein
VSEVVPFARSTLGGSPSKLPEGSLSHLPPKGLVTPRRYDLAVKHRFFRHLLNGGDDWNAERVYRWHIDIRSGARMQSGLVTDKWKKSVDDYVGAAKGLCNSMAMWFPDSCAVAVDVNGELLDGSHRVACAIARGLAEIPVRHEAREVWAPAWGRDWFVTNGMAAGDLERLEKDMAEISA